MVRISRRVERGHFACNWPRAPSQLPSAAFSEPVCVGGAVLRNCRRDPQLHRPILCQLDASDRVSGWVSTPDQGCHSTAPPQWAQISHGVLICMFKGSIEVADLERRE